MKVLALLFCALFLFTAIPSNAQPVWQTNLDGKVQFYQQTDFGIVVAGSENSLYAIDGQTGDRLWRRKHKGLDETSITPVPGTDLILLSLDEGDKSRVEAVDLLSGKSLWRSDKVKGDVMQLAVEPDTNLLCLVMVKKARGKVGDQLKRKPVIHVFRLSDGDELWKKDLESEVEMMPADLTQTGEVSFTLDNYRPPLILDGRLFLFYEGATSYDAQNGKESEREKFKVNEDSLALTEADPVFDENYVYVSGRGKVRAVSRRTGKTEWEAKDLGVTPEMALVGNVLYVRTGGQFTRIKDGETIEKGPFGVSAIDTTKGKTLWRYKGADKGLTNFVFSDTDTILIADKDDLIGLDASDGKRKFKFEHHVERAQFVLVNERGEAVIGGRDEIAAFGIQGIRSEIQNSFSEIQNRAEVWRVKHKAPGRGVFRTVLGIAARAVALYFRYGGLATSGYNFVRGALNLRSALSLRWSGLKTRFSSVNLTSLATNSARNYVAERIKTFGIASRLPNLPGSINGGFSRPQIPTQIPSLPRPTVSNIPRPDLPSRSEVQESLLDKLDPASQLDKLSNYFLRRQRLAALRRNFMYYYTDLPKPFDRKGLVGVNVHTGKDARFILVSEPDARFTTDESLGLLFTADGKNCRLSTFWKDKISERNGTRMNADLKD
jgi:outer membrane protein assembly factor BamB